MAVFGARYSALERQQNSSDDGGATTAAVLFKVEPWRAMQTTLVPERIGGAL